MSQLEPAANALADEMPTDLVEVGVYPTSGAGFDHGLVVLAVGRPYWLVPSPEGHRLFVEPQDAARVREQLARYDRESMRWPPPPMPMGDGLTHATDLITPLVWAVAVLAIFQQQAAHPRWAEMGAVDPRAIFDGGEWWRAATALFLHADGAHVVSNALSGVLLFTAVLKTFGVRRGWLLVAVSALVGNLAVAALAYPGPYHSLGASTAIFAGLGLLTGQMLRVLSRANHPHRRRAMVVALGSGLVVLALYGAGGGEARVDLGAHVGGFLAGLGLGFLAGWYRARTGRT